MKSIDDHSFVVMSINNNEVLHPLNQLWMITMTDEMFVVIDNNTLLHQQTIIPMKDPTNNTVMIIIDLSCSNIFISGSSRYPPNQKVNFIYEI